MGFYVLYTITTFTTASTTTTPDAFFISIAEDDEFDFIQPTLIQQLRNILDDYPDDGQILKVFKSVGQHLSLILFCAWEVA